MEVTAPISVTGTVTSAALASWTLEFKMQQDSSFTTLATGTSQVTNAVLGTFDPTLLLNGNALIQLRASDTSGQTTTAGPVTVVLTRNQKIGNFTVSFNDLSVPVAGLPIQVVRTYDSRVKFIGDFGVGWRLDLKYRDADDERRARRQLERNLQRRSFPELLSSDRQTARRDHNLFGRYDL
jgi:hypothetical protein